MPSTAKIVLSFIAFYLVVGFYNYSGTGGFITPFFLNYFILFAVAVYSFAINYREQSSAILGIYAFGLLAIASSHSLTLTLLNKWLGISEYSTVTASDLHKVISIIIFYGILFLIHTKAVKQHQANKWFWLPLLFLTGSLIAIFANNSLWQAILLSAYMFSFILFSNKLNSKNLQVHSALVFQYLLFIVIENIRFFTTGIN